MVLVVIENIVLGIPVLIFLHIRLDQSLSAAFYKNVGTDSTYVPLGWALVSKIYPWSLPLTWRLISRVRL